MKKALSLTLVLCILLFCATGYAASAEAPKQVTLKVFMEWPQYQEQFDKYFEQFKAKELAEKNIDVTIVTEMPNSDQVYPVLKARLASNDAPDLFTLHAISDIPLYYQAGYLMDLSDQPFVPTVFDKVREGVTYDGKVVALPMESLVWGYLYNKKIFAENAITPPQTLDEMKAVVEKLKANNVTPFLLAYQEAWVPQLMMVLALAGIVDTTQPDWVEKMNAGQASYKDVERVFDIIDLINANGTDKPFEVGNSTGCADFANGKAAMWVQGPWAADSILKSNPDMEFGVAPLPVSNDPEGSKVVFAVGTSVAVSPTTKNKEVALDLLNYLLDPVDSSALFESLKFNQVASFMTYDTFPWIAEAMTYVEQGKAHHEVIYAAGIGDETAKLMQSYYLHDMTKDEVIQDLDKTWANGVEVLQQ